VAFVERIMRSVLGPDAYVEDAVQDAFLSAFRQMNALRAPGALTEWLRLIAVGVARNRVRQRQRNRWLSFFAPEQVPERAHPPASVEVSQALRAFYAALDELPSAERLVFVLRHVEEMTVPEAAQAVRTSESTFKRRLRAAEERFDRAATRQPALAEWMRTEVPWRTR
jgi:RNA polymerase sigma-70 factor (ECF subfamily)